MSEARQAILRRTKMRGGLGRTLLTAFLLLAIGPLSAMSVYAISRTRQESEEQREQQITLLAESYRLQVHSASQNLEGALLREELSPQWFFTAAGPRRGSPPLPDWLDASLPPSKWQVGGSPPALWVTTPVGQGWSAATLPLEPILDALRLPDALASLAVYVQQGEAIVPISTAAPKLPQAVVQRLVENRNEGILTTNVKDDELAALFGRATLGDDLSLLVMQRAEVEHAAPDSLAAALVAAALLAALATTVGAALITRQITRPLYELTRAAVRIARGDLKQRATVEQDNELGILALAFNAMTSQLHETLETLEERVEQRTEELRQANAEIEERARQLELSAEIGATVSGIHNLEQLLQRGTTLIGSSFGYQNVTVWLLGRRPGRNPGLTLRACLQQDESLSEEDAISAIATLAEQALRDGCARFNEGRGSLALPLRLADNIFGSMVLTRREPFEDGDQPPLQILADTFAVAIENARASEMEGAALSKLRRIEAHRAEFLGEMSLELSTALNSIIGFSHLMLREIEGPLTDMQRSDLTFINRNGTHLLSLLDGMLDLIDSGQDPQGLSFGEKKP